MITPIHILEKIEKKIRKYKKKYTIVDRFADHGHALEFFKEKGYKVKGITIFVDADKDFLEYGDGFRYEQKEDEIYFTNPDWNDYLRVLHIDHFAKGKYIYIMNESIYNTWGKVLHARHPNIETEKVDNILIVYLL